MSVNLISDFRTWLLTQVGFPYSDGELFEYQLPDLETGGDSICAVRLNSPTFSWPTKHLSVELEVREKSGMSTAVTALDTIFGLVKDQDIMLGGLKAVCLVQSVPLPMGYDAKGCAHASLFVELTSVA